MHKRSHLEGYSPLIQSLPDGPLDIVGDVHGEIDALQDLLRHLDYNETGQHPDQRTLVFLGDLVDRGPDSPACVREVELLVATGQAQCLLGNHELNLLRQQRKHGNAWFYGKKESLDPEIDEITPQVLAGAADRKAFLTFFRSLPLALVRPDLRVVHACWNDEMVAQARGASDVMTLYEKAAQLIDERMASDDQLDTVDRRLAHQNQNPVKLLTSGPEHRVAPFWASGKDREEGRTRWWLEYDDDVFCVFGHYARLLVGDTCDRMHPFDDDDPFTTLGQGRCICVDYSVSKRWKERVCLADNRRFVSRLAALRWPEKTLVFDSGERRHLL